MRDEYENVTIIRSLDGMVWYIIPLQEGKRSKCVVDHRFRDGRLAVEGRVYSCYDDALKVVMKQKDQRDRESFRASFNKQPSLSTGDMKKR